MAHGLGRPLGEASIVLGAARQFASLVKLRPADPAGGGGHPDS
jgi:hypothetical protein